MAQVPSDPSINRFQQTQPLSSTPPGKRSAPADSNKKAMGEIAKKLQKTAGETEAAKSNLKIGARRTISNPSSRNGIIGQKRASTIAEKSLDTTQQHKKDRLGGIISTGLDKAGGSPHKAGSMRVEGSDKQLETEKFIHSKDVDRKISNLILGGNPKGSFLIRHSSQKNKLAISYNVDFGTTVHQLLTEEKNGEYSVKIGKKTIKGTIPEIINKLGGDKTIVKPSKQPKADSAQQSSAPAPGRADPPDKNILKMNREQSTAILKKQHDNSFIIRSRPEGGKEIAISIKKTSDNKPVVTHYLLTPKDGKYITKGANKPLSLEEIIKRVGGTRQITSNPMIWKEIE